MLKLFLCLPSRPCPPRSNSFATASTTKTIVRHVIDRSDILPHGHTSPAPRRVNVIPRHRQSRHFTPVLNGSSRAVAPALPPQGYASCWCECFPGKKTALSQSVGGFFHGSVYRQEVSGITNTHATVCIGNWRGIGKEINVKTSSLIPVFNNFFLRISEGRFYKEKDKNKPAKKLIWTRFNLDRELSPLKTRISTICFSAVLGTPAKSQCPEGTVHQGLEAEV